MILISAVDPELLKRTKDMLNRASQEADTMPQPEVSKRTKEPPHSHEMAGIILQMLELTAYRGLISIPDLRRFLGQPKEKFDPAVLDLSRKGKVVLHSHDHPYGLSEDEIYELVQDGKNFYIGIALK